MKYMRVIILSLFMPIYLFAEDFGKWEIVDDFEGKSVLDRISEFNFIDSLNGMLFQHVGDIGYAIRRTTDAGKSWDYVYIDTVHWSDFPKIWDFQYVSKKLVLAVGDSGKIIRSIDNGDSWETYRIDTLMSYAILGMYDENEGFMLGGRTDSIGKGLKIRFWKTYDGGISWQEEYRSFFDFDNGVLHSFDFLQNVNRNLVIFGSNFTDDDTIRHYLTVKVYNDWTSWDTVSRPSNSYYRHFVDENTGWMVGINRYKDTNGNNAVDQLIYHTSDGGKTWEKQRDKYFYNAYLTQIKFYDENFGIAGSEIRWVLMTSDGGKTWHEIRALEYDSGEFNSITHISIPTPNVAYVLSAWPNEVLKWTRTPTSVVEDYNGSDFFITPNPASDYIEIQMTNHTLKGVVGAMHGGVVESVKVFDVLGNVVVSDSITHPLTPSQEGEILRLDISALAPGVYFVKVGGQVSKFVKM